MTITSNESCGAIMPDYYRDVAQPGSSKFVARMFHVKQLP
jgi:hypothetical protein